MTLVHAQSYHPWAGVYQLAWPQQASWQACKEGTWQNPRFNTRRKKRHCPLLLGTHLKELDKENPDNIVIVRKISRLGFKSAEILQEHFERFGTISKVLLSNKQEREDGQVSVRLRPSGIGFLVFENSESVERALAEGEVQTVADVEICVRAFERRRSDSTTTATDSDNENSPTETKDVSSHLETL